MLESISILDVVKRGGFEASLITTFNAHLPFYEEVVLRKLVAAGCRHNVVLMDRNQCAVSWASEASRPRLAGSAYTLLPVGVPGAFHPKICILVGRKKASILIGSHNLTLSGFGFNREITNWIEVSDTKDVAGLGILAQAWNHVSRWIELERGKAPGPLVSSALEFANFISPMISNSSSTTSEVVLAQDPGSTRLVDQLSDLVPDSAKRIGIVGAFFDSELALIKEFSERWPKAEIVVGIDPETVHLTGDPIDIPARFVDSRLLPSIGSTSYPHAKVFYFEAEHSDSLVASGSANPSRPAWMGNASSCNVEAMLVRRGPVAVEVANEIGLASIFDLPCIDPSRFAEIRRRGQQMLSENPESPIPLFIGIADHESGKIRIDFRGKTIVSDTVELCGQHADTVANVAVDPSKHGDLNVKVEKALPHIGSCRLLRDGQLVGRVMVHHPEIIAASAKSSKQSQIREALAGLGFSDGDISSVIASVEKVIFSDDAHGEVSFAIKEQKQKSTEASSQEGPETLAISVVDLPKVKKKSRLLKSGDLAYLLDVLVRRLGVGLESRPTLTDAAGRTEEEQVGQDDEPGESGQPSTNLTDQQVAIAVASKAGKLVKRMLRQLEKAASTPELQPTAVIQLIAVLGLIRELRHLGNTPRWKRAGHSLVKVEDRRSLMEGAVKYLLGSPQFLRKIEVATGEKTDEAVQLKVLMLWLAYDLGESFNEKFSHVWEKKERESQLRANGFFVEVMPSIVDDEAARSELEKSLSRTTKPTPKDTLYSQHWLDKHWNLGTYYPRFLDKEQPVRVGSYCTVPGIIDSPRVAIAVPNDQVWIWDFDKIRQFQRARVMAMRS